MEKGGVYAVVNENAYAVDIEFPAKSFTPVKTVTVYFVPAVNAAVGVTVHVLLSVANPTARFTLVFVAAFLNEIFCHIMVEDCMGSLNTIVTFVFTAIPVALLAGVVDETVGGVVSEPVAVVADAISDGVPVPEALTPATL